MHRPHGGLQNTIIIAQTSSQSLSEKHALFLGKSKLISKVTKLQLFLISMI